MKSAALSDASVSVLVPSTQDDLLIEAVYVRLRQIERDATVIATIAMGRTIVEAFYGGDLDVWRARGAKDMSFRKLSARFNDDGYAMSSTTLYRAVAIYELEVQHQISRHELLSVTHLRTLLGQPPERTALLIEDCLRHKWSADHLERQVRALGVQRRGGRPRQPAFVRTLRAVDRLLGGDLDPLAGVEAIDRLDPSEAMALYVAANRMRKRGEEMARLLQNRATAKGIARAK